MHKKPLKNLVVSEIKKGSCHCGAILFQVELEKGLEDIRRCNCSLCSRKGYVMASVPLLNLTLLKGSDNLSCYSWNTKTAKHYFCQTCGIHTHHQRRSKPGEFGINIACLEGIDPYQYSNIPIGNGQKQTVIE
jgi:hypothetical protein